MPCLWFGYNQWSNQNKAVVSHNKKVDKCFALRMKVWISFLQQKESAKKANDTSTKISWLKDPVEKGKLMKRMPKKGAYKCQILQCMAATSKCLMQGSDCCTSYPIKCVDENGKRYKWVGLSCSCPVCRSMCQAAYSVSKFNQIAIQVSVLKFTKEAGLDKTQFEKMQKLQGLFAGWFGNGITAAKNMRSKRIQIAMAVLNQIQVVIWNNCNKYCKRCTIGHPIESNTWVGQSFLYWNKSFSAKERCPQVQYEDHWATVSSGKLYWSSGRTYRTLWYTLCRMRTSTLLVQRSFCCSLKEKTRWEEKIIQS